MNDHIAAQDLAAYVDGVLRGAPRTELESHLSRCPECLAALAEIVNIQGCAVKIPEEFLRRALKTVPPRSAAVPGEGILGEKPSPVRAVLPMRLVFGVAAVFLVAVLIGFYFLDLGHKETAGIVEKGMPQPAVSAQAHPSLEKTAGERKARRETAESALPAREDQAEAVSALKLGKKSAIGEAKPGQPAALQTGKMKEPAALPGKTERLQLADKKDMAQLREAEGGAGGVLGGVEAPQEKDKEALLKSAAVAATPGARTEDLSKNAEEIPRLAAAPGRSKGAALAAGAAPRSRFPGSNASVDAMQVFLAVTGHAAAPPAVEFISPAKQPAIRIAGDVSRADLSDPGYLDSWSWFPAGLALELDIDAAGTVVAVIPVGPWEEKAAALAEAAARELRFPASGRRSRRAVLTVAAPPPN